VLSCSGLAIALVRVGRGVTGDEREGTQWKIYGERLVDESPFIRLSIASVGLPDGTEFEQYVMRMRRPPTPRRGKITPALGHPSSARVSAGGGRCWVRTNVG
jgi:hypothetical protein